MSAVTSQTSAPPPPLAPEAPPLGAAHPNRKSGIYTDFTSKADSPAAVEIQNLASSQQFFALYINNPTELIRFLETIAARRYGKRLDASLPPLSNGIAAINSNAYDPHNESSDEQAIWNTLLELYLTTLPPRPRQIRPL